MLDVITPASLDAVSWPSLILLLHGIPLGVAFEQTRPMLLDKGVRGMLPWCEVDIIWGEIYVAFSRCVVHTKAPAWAKPSRSRAVHNGFGLA
jgi:hypothetical protein